MATIPTQIRMDTNVKEQATVVIPRYNQETLDAMAEARRIAEDANVRGYKTMKELTAALEADD